MNIPEYLKKVKVESSKNNKRSGSKSLMGMTVRGMAKGGRSPDLDRPW